MKKSKKVTNNYIPIFLSIISIFLSTMYHIGTCQDVITYRGLLLVLFSSITQAILVTALAVFSYELYKNKINQVSGGDKIEAK